MLHSSSLLPLPREPEVTTLKEEKHKYTESMQSLVATKQLLSAPHFHSTNLIFMPGNNAASLRCNGRCDAICDGGVRCELVKYDSQKKSTMRRRLADLAQRSMQVGTSPWYLRGFGTTLQATLEPLYNFVAEKIKIIRHITCRIAKVEPSPASAMAQLRQLRES